MTVGNVGAGNGYFRYRLAARVGASGRVIAEDTDAAELQRIRVRCAREQIRNGPDRQRLLSTPGARTPSETLEVAHGLASVFGVAARPVRRAAVSEVPGFAGASLATLAIGLGASRQARSPGLTCTAWREWS